MATERSCEIIEAALGFDSHDGGVDGAYDLHGISGNPEEIGKAIGESLKESDIYSGKTLRSAIDDRDLDIYLTLTIKFGRKKETNEE